MAKLLTPVTEYFFKTKFLQAKKLHWQSVVKTYKTPVERFTLKPINSYIPQTTFTGDVASAIEDRLCGVKVIWTPSGYGKSTYIREVCKKMQEDGDKISGAIITNATHTLRSHPSLTGWLSDRMGAPGVLNAPWFNSISDLLPVETSHKPVALVIDQFDHLKDIKDAQSFVISLAEDSLRTKKFVTLLALTDASYASQILRWNGGQKISLLGPDPTSYKWNERHFSAFWKVLEEEERKRIEISSDQKVLSIVPEQTRKQFIDICALAGTPGFFLNHVRTVSNFTPHVLEESAKITKNFWDDGIKQIHSAIGYTPKR